MSVHDVAERGFGSEAEAYERSRPSYPPEAVAWFVEHLRLGPGVTTVDLAAGTGKFTRLLIPSGADLVAAEPVDGMRTVLSRSLAEVPVVAGVAEALPLADASVDAVTVAQAFHWFDADAAFVELARVIRPGGRLGIVWNARDRSVDWVDQVWAIVDRIEKEAPWRDHDNWRATALGARPGFGELHEATFHHEHSFDHAGGIERFRGVSHVAALPPERRDAVLDQVRAALAGHPDTRDSDELTIPYRVDCFWCERR